MGTGLLQRYSFVRASKDNFLDQKVQILTSIVSLDLSMLWLSFDSGLILPWKISATKSS